MPAYVFLMMGAALLLVVASGMIARTHFSTRRKIVDRLLQQQQRNNTAAETIPLRRHLLATWSESLLRLPVLGETQRIDASRKLIAAGYRGLPALAALMAITALCALLGLSAAALWLWPAMEQYHWVLRVPALIAGFWLGTMVPRLVLERLVVRRQKAVVRGLPDALDLMIICTNAGLGLNACLQRVATEMAPLNPAVADEFALTFAEAQLSGDARTALRHMAERVDVAGVKSLVATLTQAQRYGTPITQALRVLANGERRARLLALEEKAGKLGTKITLPMMLFILPPVLIVTGGPAVLQLIQSFP